MSMRIDVYVNQAKDLLTTLVSFFVSQICQIFSPFYAFIYSVSSKFDLLYHYLNWWNLTKLSKHQNKNCLLYEIFSKILWQSKLLPPLCFLSTQIFLFNLHITVVSHVCHFLLCCEPFKGKDRDWDMVGILKMLNEWRKD